MNIADVVTFTRASGGTYFDADGVMQLAGNDEWRLDHDPLTGESLGILIEEARTNLLWPSNDFSHSNWSRSRISVTPNATTAPDGTLTASLLTEDTTPANTHQLLYNFTGVLDQASYRGVFVKKAPGGRRYVQVWTGSFANQSQRSQITFDLDTGTGVVSGAPIATADVKIEELLGGWWRLTPYTVSNGLGGSTLAISLMDDTQSVSYDGDGVSGIYVWGAQNEIGLFPTSYIPTTTAAATRAADMLARYPTDGWINALSGSLFIELIDGDSAVTRYATTLARGTGTTIDGVSVYFAGSTGELAGRVGTTSLAVVTPNGAGAADKVALAYDDSTGAASINGATTVSGLRTVPVMETLTIGSRRGGGDPFNGHIKRITYFPRRLSDAELVEITS